MLKRLLMLAALTLAPVCASADGSLTMDKERIVDWATIESLDELATSFCCADKDNP